MNILDTDKTTYIFPTAGHYTSETVFTESGDFIYWLSNMSDNFPINYTQFYAGVTNTIDVRTINSQSIGIAGANIKTVTVHIVDGIVHDVNDLIDNGKYDDWDSALTTPDNWTIEADCNIAYDTTSLSVGGISYSEYVNMTKPDSTSDNSMYQQVNVSANTKYKLSILYYKAHTSNAQYYIYDNDNTDFIEEDIYFTNPEFATPANILGWMNTVFTTPAGCTSINIGIRTLDAAGNQIAVYGVALHPVTTSYDAVDVSNSRLYAGSQFNSYYKEYTKITGNHSVVLEVESVSHDIKIGRIITGLLEDFEDPRIGMGQGLEFNSVKSDLRYGGRLLDAKYNQDTFYCTVIMLNSDVHDFIYTVVPRLKKDPAFFILGDLTGQQWSVYARFGNNYPDVRRNDHLSSTVTFNLIEAI